MHNLGQGWIQGAIAPLKPTKVTLFTMSYTIQKTTFAIRDHFFVHCFITAVLRNSLYFISLTVEKPWWDLTTKYYWNRHHP